MKNRNIHEFAQALLDDKALRRFNVFKVNAPEGRPQISHSIDKFIGIRRVDFEINAVDISKTFKEDGFPLHHRLRCQRPQIAEA